MRVSLLLDEMHAPVVAVALRDRGHDVVAVVEQDELRVLTDEDVFRWALEHERCIVTENVTDFAPLSRRAEESGQPNAALLFSRNPGLLIDALDAWLRAAESTSPSVEDWLPCS